jgi:hypothetical protein
MYSSKVTAIDVKRLGPSAAREIGTFSMKTMGPTPKGTEGAGGKLYPRSGITPVRTCY